MAKIDRLTTLLNNFRLQASVAKVEDANLVAMHEPATGEECLIFTPRAVGIDADDRNVLFSLHIDFGTNSSPLCAALPDKVIENVTPDGDLASIVSLLASEQQANRCGCPAVLSRLGEVLVVRMLRLQLDRGVTTPGLLAGLANPRISQAIVAIHENPGHLWQNADLADTAGLSHSRFKEVFSKLVGVTPASYLRRWRLTLARADLEKGERVDRIAHRYGYRAPDAFSRAYLREFGVRPTKSASK
ncbi:AraC family transcriptional regulator [Tateyamaria omphalii]|uniref:AraC family transcriptional regulator n=1 Tax=Tateyamaria omphalii TaxID=299262 RepID=UPI001C999A8D|nr:AraC family transcriptional regulator [Tateyamaria omphalii]MBY5933506.1 AraC family transcriptional regulator [Tateyamaria omphalii]